jgi:hypothetical protein
MSTSYSAKIMAGVKADDALTRNKETKEVTKYYEDTGNPYTKEVVVADQLFFGTHQIEEPYDLEAFFDIGYSEHAVEIIGENYIESEDLNYGGCDIDEIDIDKAQKVIAAVNKKLLFYGVFTKAKLYLVCSAA